MTIASHPALETAEIVQAPTRRVFVLRGLAGGRGDPAASQCAAEQEAALATLLVHDRFPTEQGASTAAWRSAIRPAPG